MKKFLYIIIFLLAINQAYTQEDTLKKVKTHRNPKVAVILSTVAPGTGQIYNRKYWKTPIIWGGFVPIVYNVDKFHKEYKKYYYDISLFDIDSLGQYYLINPNDTTLSGIYDVSKLKTSLNENRRSRDLFAFAGIIFWTLNIIDAYVDAELSNFDVSEDLSVNIYPSVNNFMGQNYFSVNMKFNFKYDQIKKSSFF